MKQNNEDRRLIEESLPIKEVSEEGSKERSIREGNISTLHQWWARKPIIASRAAVFASMVRYPKDSKEKSKLINQVITLCKWENSNNRRTISEAKEKILACFNGKTPKILDCFAGGGSIPLETARLGLDAYSSDLNPVAYITQLVTLKYPTVYRNSNNKKEFDLRDSENKLIRDITKWGQWVLLEAEKELREYYPPDDDGSTPLAYLWARSIKCPNPNCRADIPLLAKYWLCEKPDKKVAFKPTINKERSYVSFKIVEDRKIDFNPSIGNVKRGTVECFICGHTTDSKHLREEFSEGRAKEILIGVVNYKEKSGKIYREATNKDVTAFQKAKERLTKESKKQINKISSIPDEPLPPIGSLGFRIQRYGFKKWGDVFNARQLLSLITLTKKIREAYEIILKEERDREYAKCITTYLALQVDKMADFNSVFCVLNHVGGRGVVNTFRMQTVNMIWNYAETNPFNQIGASWSSNLKSTLKTLKSLIDAELQPVNISICDATNLPYENEYFDAVIIDPPYYDAIPYSNLSDFFYVWLKRTIGDLYPEGFGTLVTPKTKEIIQEPIRFDNNVDEAKKFFESKMTLALKDINRVLKEDGLFVMIFAHKYTSAWETLLNSILESGFIVNASWPLHTERPGRVRAQESATLASSIFIVCRKRLTSEEGYFNEIKDELKEKIYKKLDEFWKQGIRGADFFISAIGPAVEVFGKYKKVKKLSGEEVTVAELLDEVRKIVTDYSLHQILRDGQLGSIDDMTRFYVLWRWAYGNADVPFDDARKLAQALGTEPDELLSKKGMLNKKGDKVSMFEPWDRKDEHLGEPKHGMPAPMVDVIHRTCKLIDKNEDISKFIEESDYARDDSIKKVIQAIAEILPEGDKERRLLQILNNKLSNISVESDRFKSQTTLQSYKGEEK